MRELRLVVICGVPLWIGASLLLGELASFSRPSLVGRLAPYGRSRRVEPDKAGAFSVASFREVIGPLSRTLGGRLARLFGVSEELSLRLERIHSNLDVTSFRVHQLGWMLACLGAALLVCLAVRPPAIVGVLVVPSASLLAFLVLEQRLASASAAWQHRVFLELPVVSEQLAMLLSAGYSLGTALSRIAERGNGACATDLARVVTRIRQGLTETDALREWAAVARVEALDRVVAVLALNSEASDVGRLVSDEAATVRRDVQRSFIVTMERRGQQVWVPVTVATLVPGVIFLVVPFVDALRYFSGS